MFAHWRDNTFLFSAIVIVGAVMASWLLDQLFGSTAAVLLILQLAVVVVAFQCNSRFAYAAAVIEALSFNFFFTTPRYSLQMFRPEDIFNLVVFMVVAFITSTFADLYRRQQGELKQTKLQNSILLSVSHDLRTTSTIQTGTLTTIGTLTTLNEYMPKLNDLERKELLDSATSESHRLHQYIENLLQATKLQHGTLKITKKDELIANIVRDAVSRLPSYTEKVSMNMDDAVGYLSVSRSLIEQAIFNVLDNAMRFSPENESVEVSLSKQGLSCVIDVRDMGIGIKAEDAEKIFNLFYSGANNKSADSGTGMGLAVAKGIITAHQGEIQSMPVSEGTLIRIRLPLNQGAEQA
ncbi:sensor histidine kinase [Vibrio parahaemolyticus]|uniref:sensor histidine kinase n=1 Tax=Vibrio parahaemolyticus TaxID=670 RepID=UPI0015DF0403|nr:ATP-binding protein [Vibrio parahaemolyticus]